MRRTTFPFGPTLVGAALLLLVACGRPAPAGVPAPSRGAAAPEVPVFVSAEGLDREARAWVDTTLASLSLRDLVAQLVVEWMPGGYVSPSAPDFAPLEEWVAHEGIGGVSPSIGTPHAYAAKINALQARARIPLLVTADFENGGPGMRINGSYALPSLLPQGGGTDFPPTMAFGAIGDERFAYEYGRITAREARALGVHFLFAPVLDVNNNPDNPVIATRSFGGDPELVARMGAAFVRGARAGGAFTTGKHFPGHGDTDVDSHLGIPLVVGDRARLDAVELLPFVRAIQEGVDAVMTAHVSVPTLLGLGAPPATLSPEFLTGLLREDLGFDGVLFTDALTMKAIADGYGMGEASVRSLIAGADVLLSPKEVALAIDAVVAAVEEGRLTRSRIEESVRKLLVLKARLGLHERRFVSLDAVDGVVGSGAHLAFADTAASRSITLPRDRDGLLPLDPGAEETLLHVRYAPSRWLWAGRAFSAGLAERGIRAVEIPVDERTDSAEFATLVERLDGVGSVVVSAYVSPGAGSGPDAVPEGLRSFMAEAVRTHPTVLVSLGSPYLLGAFPDVGSYLVAWGNREVSQRAAVRALFGEAPITGKLPISLPPFHQVGEGLEREQVVTTGGRAAVVDDPLVAAGIVARGARDQEAPAVTEVAADSVGMSETTLARLDSLILAGIADSVASGVSLAVGRHGRLVRLRGYGELAWGSGRPATPTSVWDMASVSKVVGTTTAAMMLVDEGKLDLDAPVVRYLPWWSRGDARKEGVTVRQLLLHRAGLTPFRRWFFERSGVQEYKDAAADEALEYEPGTRTSYSDIGIMTVAWVIEEVSGQSLDAFLAARLWRPLGMNDTGYRPHPELKPRIAATEMDTLWRGGMVWGRVHDENADAMGGVAGHAGLFSTAVDLSVFAQMMLDEGFLSACRTGEVSGGPCPVTRRVDQRLVDSATIEHFTHRYDGTASRALGWDTPTEGSSSGDFFTAEAFGHTGYTGTSIWIDPELDLFVVLLTNRVHPTRENGKHVPFRRAVHDLAVNAITDVRITPRIP
ncbi:MAG: serine hydrolase [Gemmatimonadota bacterium]|nr:serine hydrolase [Gemmatimonadota bacterium]MDH5759553.1 serine hydrolase [Gemmatimonadota bacterium]